MTDEQKAVWKEAIEVAEHEVRYAESVPHAKDEDDYFKGWRAGAKAVSSNLKGLAKMYTEAVSRAKAPSATCQWSQEVQDDDGQPIGWEPYCGAPATHTACTPIVGMSVCEKHKCRCSKPLEIESTPCR